TRELLDELLERAAQAEIREHAGSQSACDLADIVEALAHRLLCELRLLAQRLGRAVGDAAQAQQRDREALADLVVQLAGDALAFSLLRGDGERAAREVFGVETAQARAHEERVRRED